MTQTIIVTGTDTGIGKTVFAAALTAALNATYWKPIQSGLEPDGSGDRDIVGRLTAAPANRILPETYRLTTPCSPHLAAELDGVTLDLEALTPPKVDGPLVVEGAGGVMVPVTRTVTYVDVFARWGHPVVIVARTALGTINHTLLTIEALRNRNVAIIGVAFVGDENEDTEATIAAMGGVKRLGRLPHLAELNAQALAEAFVANFNLDDFTA